MTSESIQTYALGAAILIAAVAAMGEWLHTRRIIRLGTLAFGPAGRPRRWTALAPVLRVAALAGIAWSLVTLTAFNNRGRERERHGNTTRHLMVLLDVSPSMFIGDAGESGKQRRAERAGDVLKSVLNRVPGDNIRFSAAGFYTEARMLVKECEDRELILHLTAGTPFHITYQPGKTDLLKSRNEAGKMMKDWPRKSTTLLVISDGDSVPPKGLEAMPSAVAEVIIAGVGDPGRGTFLDGHMSRQDVANLSQLARRLGGNFHDCNMRHVPDERLRKLNEEPAGAAKWRSDLRLLAIAVLTVSAAILCALPVLLDLLGSAWRPRPPATTPPARATP